MLEYKCICDNPDETHPQCKASKHTESPSSAGSSAGDSWLIYFEDSEMDDEIIDHEETARKRFEALALNWTVHLYKWEASR